ncbi:hypothetical protein OSTOST_24114, partial [Ostertagia ostertagi]
PVLLLRYLWASCNYIWGQCNTLPDDFVADSTDSSSRRQQVMNRPVPQANRQFCSELNHLPEKPISELLPTTCHHHVTLRRYLARKSCQMTTKKDGVETRSTSRKSTTVLCVQYAERSMDDTIRCLIICDESGCQFSTREARYIHFHKYYRHHIPLPDSIDLGKSSFQEHWVSDGANRGNP